MLPALIAAGATIAGGLLSNKSQKDANRANEAHALRQEQLQKDFAQQGIQWKVKDAEAAGVHPLYALGANTTSYQPTQVGGGASDFSFLGDAGQNIGRAIQSQMPSEKRALALQTTAAALQNEGLQLDNELKRTQLISAVRLANQPGTGPGVPSLPPPGHEDQPPTFTRNLRIAGRDWFPNPRYSNADAFEQRYGEMSDYAFGPAIFVDDYKHNMPAHRPWTDIARRSPYTKPILEGFENYYPLW